MRHYEIVFLIHPDQSDQTHSVLSKFSSIISDSGGVVHRSENIGRRKLAYPIQDQFKASYALINVECNNEAIEEIKSSFKFNDSIIRNLITLTKKAHSEQSALSTQTQEEDIENLPGKEEASLATKTDEKKDKVRKEEQKSAEINEDSKEDNLSSETEEKN